MLLLMLQCTDLLPKRRNSNNRCTLALLIPRKRCVKGKKWRNHSSSLSPRREKNTCIHFLEGEAVAFLHYSKKSIGKKTGGRKEGGKGLLHKKGIEQQTLDAPKKSSPSSSFGICFFRLTIEKLDCFTHKYSQGETSLPNSAFEIFTTARKKDIFLT